MKINKWWQHMLWAAFYGYMGWLAFFCGIRMGSEFGMSWNDFLQINLLLICFPPPFMIGWFFAWGIVWQWDTKFGGDRVGQ